MKTILTSVLVGSLLTTLAVAEQPSRFAGRRGFAYNPERRTAQTSARGAASLMVYAITIGFEFGAVDLRSGAFLPIGPALPAVWIFRFTSCATRRRWIQKHYRPRCSSRWWCVPWRS